MNPPEAGLPTDQYISPIPNKVMRVDYLADDFDQNKLQECIFNE
jgi:hypothetical protein